VHHIEFFHLKFCAGVCSFLIRSSFELDYDFIEDGDEYKDVDSEDDEDDYNEDYKEHDDNNIEAPRDYQDQDSEEQDFSYIEYVNVSPLRAADTWLPPGPRSRCHEQTKATLERMYSSPIIDSMDASLALMEYTSCVEANLTQELLSTSEELEFQFNALVNAANYFENYTCSDYNLPTSPSIRNETWTYKGMNYEVGIMHERPRSMIHVLSNFVTEEECQAIDEAATTGLHAGTLAGEITPERKVMQAYIPVDWEKEAEGDIIAKLSRRLYDYVNHATGLGIREKGQEDIMSIQYAGRGTNETHPDRYVPHCDGDCDGSPYSLGARFATMIMYCTTPLKGGSTNFLNAGIHVVATKGAATFFSYIGSDDFINDNGFTRHSGCPVIEGEKKIITQFFRVGVDDDHPWDFFET